MGSAGQRSIVIGPLAELLARPTTPASHATLTTVELFFVSVSACVCPSMLCTHVSPRRRWPATCIVSQRHDLTSQAAGNSQSAAGRPGRHPAKQYGPFLNFGANSQADSVCGPVSQFASVAGNKLHLHSSGQAFSSVFQMIFYLTCLL